MVLLPELEGGGCPQMTEALGMPVVRDWNASGMAPLGGR